MSAPNPTRPDLGRGLGLRGERVPFSLFTLAVRGDPCTPKPAAHVNPPGPSAIKTVFFRSFRLLRGDQPFYGFTSIFQLIVISLFLNLLLRCMYHHLSYIPAFFTIYSVFVVIPLLLQQCPLENGLLFT